MYKLIRTLLPVLAAMIATTVSAQSVSWKSSVQHLDGQTYRIVLEASIPAPWHMYDMGPYEGGPNATTITFTPGEGAVLEGGVEQLTRPERHYDKTFGMEIGTFARKAQFAQSVKLTAPQATVKAELAWMICNDTSCLPPDDTELTITLPAGATPAVQPAETPAKESAAAPETVPAAEIAPAQKDAAGGGSLWGLIIEAILWGFAALLTPCVFPMVPMTVSFFMKGSGSPALGRIRAGMYGFFIVALYTLPIAAIILITRLVGGDAVTADIFNWLATHWLPNILFFLVFMVFAASFFGAFEITMPSWMVNKTDSKADSKDLAGIFFMALTLVLVSFSCTGPIVGSVLANLGGIIVISQGSLYLALATFLRVAAIAVPGVILALGLDPTDLADGLVQILRLPQRFVYGGLAGMRMFTLLQDDWRALGQSRRSRGLGDGSTIKRVFSQAFSLLVVSIRRGTKLATAMEARGFGSDAPRSQARESKLHAVDWLFYAICIAVPAIALATAYYTGYWHWAFSGVSN